VSIETPAKKTSSSPAWNEGLDARYVPGFVAKAEADRLMARLLDLDWGHDRIRIFGKEHAAPRLTAWYGDLGISYHYSGVTHVARPWTNELAALRERVVADTGAHFNFVLANLYRDGADSLGWHSDDERVLGKQPVIASLSFGATRRLRFRTRTAVPAATTAIDLEHGSLLVMFGQSQREWQHSLPRTKRVHDARINLTFRRLA
jgi:alkylated DNA repair dioxygenase AlkB